VNWSREYGDLRIAHFIGMHALQVLPFAGWRLGKHTATIKLVAGLYFLLAVFVLVRALQGHALM
jgi:hypothetical protein